VLISQIELTQNAAQTYNARPLIIGLSEYREDRQ
ncbi:uncharacterized protein METZ01_LOCUS61035, partial [marine metagenome]